MAATLGDRRQEIVLIGRDLDRRALTALLDTTLLTDSEMRLGQPGWNRFHDPFGVWAATEESFAPTTGTSS